jgi:hypothetical protein
MSTIHHVRQSDSPFVQSVSLIEHSALNQGMATPDGCWDMVILKRHEGVAVFRTGMLTRAIPLQRQAGEELLTISLPASMFMPWIKAARLVDQAFDFPMVGPRAVMIDGSVVELPSFHNAEMFVEVLVRKGILEQDELVASVLQGRPKAMSLRTLQRHFVQASGITANVWQRIQQAQRAVALLQHGMSPYWVAAEVGYFDQAHMTKILKLTMGQTPGEIIRDGANTTKPLIV